MRNLNFLRKSERKSVGTTLALTVGSPSAHRRYSALKHLAFMLLFLLGSLNVWGYTITFSTGSGDGTSASTSTACSTIVSDGASYLSGNLVTATRVYYSGDYGLKLGASSNAGTIKMNLASSVTPTSIVVRAKLYNSSKATTLKVNGSATQSITSSFSDLTFNITSSTSYIQLESSKYCWIESITVNTGSSDPTVSVTPASWDFGTVHASADASKVFSVSGSNLTAGNLTLTVPDGFSVDPSSIAVDGTLAATNVTVSKNTSTEDDYAGNLSITGGGLANAKTVALTMTVDADPAPTGTFNKYSGTTLPDGYYVICSGSTTTAMKNTATTAPRIEYATVDIVSNTITNPDESVIWKLENLTGVDAGYFTLYNEAVEKYAAFTSANGNANVIASVTDYAKFALEENSSFDFLNKGKTGRYLRLNGTNGFANYASSTGAALTLYKKASAPKAVTVDGSIENGHVYVTGAADLSAVAEGTELTLSNTPADGYKLTAYDVYKTGESATKVTVTNNKFTMPDYDVTVSATFEVAKVLTSIEITTQASQKTFWLGETFDYDGLVVTAHFEGAADEVVTPTSISEPAMNVDGEKTITVSYTEGTTTKEATYTIDVKVLPTEANPGSVADMIDIWDKLGNQSDMYVRGTIYQINGFFSGKYISYWITDSYDAEAEPNHTNAFELYNGLDFNGASFTAKEDLELGQEVVVKGNLTRFGSSAPYTYEFGANNIIISRPKVLKSIELSGSQPTEFTQGDEFSSEGLVVTATYNYGDNAIVPPTSITGYNMLATGNQTVTVSYTETGVTKTATYDISVAAPDLCEHKATISKGEEVNGTFELSVSGELCLDELADNKTSTVLTAVPAEHYHLSEVTATVGTVGAISDNSCTISEINASTTITAVFAEDDKATLTFAKGEADGGEAAPVNIEDYAGEVTLPACPFTYTGHYFIGWKKGETEEIYQPGAYTITAEDVTADAIAFTAQWAEGYVFEWIADGHGYEDAEEVTTVTEGTDPITITFDANTGTTPKYYTSGTAVRAYVKNTLTIVAGENKVITGINVTFANGTNNKLAGTGFTVDGTSGTWSGTAAQQVALNVPEVSGNQARITKIVVYYKEGVVSTLEIDNIEMEYGEVVTISPKTVTPDAAASHVSYEIKAGSDDCITREGNQITAKSVTGTATIVATIPDAEGGEYIGTSIEFTVSVSAPDSRKKAQSPNAGFASISGDLNADIAYAAYQGGGTAAAKINGTAIQLYQPGSGEDYGGFVTVTAVKGCKIDQVKITTATNATKISYSKDGGVLSDPQTDNIPAGSDYLTPAELNAQSVNLYCMGGGSSNRLYIAAMTVYYTGEPVPVHHLKLGGEYPTEFEQGAAFSHEGLVVTACYDELETDTEVVTDQAIVSTPNMNVAGQQTITVSFGGKTAEYTITVNAAEGTDDLTGTWNLVTDAADLMAGMKVIIAQYVESDGAIYTMGDQKSNNRDAVASTVAGTTLAPNFRTRVFVLEDAGNGMFALKSEENGKYLYAAAPSSNHMKSQDNVDANAKWTISVSEGVASIVATESSNRNVMRYNESSKLFSCYEDGQKDIALYAKQFDYTRNVSGNYATICLPKAGKIYGASLYEIAYYGATSKKIFFDEIVNGEMEAGIPYIFQPAAGVEKIGVYYSDNTAADVTAGNRNGLIGFYDLNNPAATHNINQDEGYYILYNNQYWLVSGREAYIENYRAYIQLNQINPSEPTLAPGHRRISMSVNDTQTATGIESAEANEAPHKVLINGELFILRGEKMYDAKGQLVK